MAPATETTVYDLEAAKAAARDPNVPIDVTGVGSVAGLQKASEKKTGRGVVAKDCGRLEINYDILEAAGEERLGGRLYTRKFSEGDTVKTHDYYDVGAMRFPNNDIMKRTFQLFNFIGLEQGKGGIIPYYLEDELGVCPSCYNDARHVGDAWGKGIEDPFNINCGLPEGGKISKELLAQDPSKLISQALAPLIKETKDPFQEALKEIDARTVEGDASKELWKRLMAADY